MTEHPLRPRGTPPRAPEDLIACPHCGGAVDATVEADRARVELLNVLWTAFLENGADIEPALWDLEAALEARIAHKERARGPIGAFIAETRREEADARWMVRRILQVSRRRVDHP
jgi:hypothetical protein